MSRNPERDKLTFEFKRKHIQYFLRRYAEENPVPRVYNVRTKPFAIAFDTSGFKMPKYNSKHPGYRISRARRQLMVDAALRAVQMGAKRLKRRYGSTTLRAIKRKRISPQSSRRRKKKYQRIVANTSGTTHTTSRMIVRKTPKSQKLIRKIFREGEANHVKYVQRFGFSFIGAAANNQAIWYSITHLKFNNIVDMLYHRTVSEAQDIRYETPNINGVYTTSNQPTNFIYLGKCTFNYELYNPTNYNMTVYIYDLICKHDTPQQIQYGSTQVQETSSSPEMCMQQSANALQNTNQQGGWIVADPTDEVQHGNNDPQSNPTWRTVGMKPTDYYYFNAMWKVKGMKKIILPPASAHHHVVVFNPKQKITLGSFMYRNQRHEKSDKHGIAGLTQSTLFGIEGQVATESDQQADNEKVGTLPAKLIIKCVRKLNTYNFSMRASTIISKNQLQDLAKPEIFSDLFEVQPEHT